MTFEGILDQAIAMLQRRRRVTYRTLKLHFHLDDECLEALAEALIEAERVAADEAGKVLVWTPHAGLLPGAARTLTVRNTLLLLLACTAGGVDAVSYLQLGHVFTANMTGNTVLLGLALGQVASQAIIGSSLALVGFLAGVALGACITYRRRPDGVWPPSVTVALMVEWGLLVAWMVGWHLMGDPASKLAERGLLIGLSALAMGTQSAVGRRLDISGIATTYITGTLTNFIARLVDRACGVPMSQTIPARVMAPMTPSAGLLAATWLIYIGGAAVAATATSLLGALAALVFTLTLMTAVILTALIYFRQP
jgi:uncharacterized membrane protein YoaK (UPF0700 family)